MSYQLSAISFNERFWFFLVPKLMLGNGILDSSRYQASVPKRLS